MKNNLNRQHEYRIITELGVYGYPSSDLDDTITNGFDDLPESMSWEIRDEMDEVVFTHYIEEEG